MESIIAAVVLVIGLIGWSIADGILAGLKGLVSDAVKAVGKKLAARIESLFGKRWKIIALASISVVAAPLCGVALYFNFNLHHIARTSAKDLRSCTHRSRSTGISHVTAGVWRVDLGGSGRR